MEHPFVVWLYSNPLLIGIVVMVFTIGLSVLGREYWPRTWRKLEEEKKEKEREYPDGLNDAVGGALGVLGVFYGVTVGLITVDVWQRQSAAQELVSKEAAAIQSLYLSVQREPGLGKLDINNISLPRTLSEGTSPTGPTIGELCTPLARLSADYLKVLKTDIWSEQKNGAIGSELKKDRYMLHAIRLRLQAFEPASDGEAARYSEALRGLSHLIELRRRRVDALDDKLSRVMWTMIVVGAVITMCLAYQLWLKDEWRHRVLVGLLSAGLGLPIWMIAANNRPFLGEAPSFGTDPFKGVVWIIDASKKYMPDEECVTTLTKKRAEAT